MGPEYNFPYCIMAGFITAIAVSYFTRLTFIKLVYRKDFERYRELDSITNGGGADKFMRGFLWVIVTVCLVACLFFVKWNLNFMPNGFTDNSEFWSLEGEYYPYSQIEYVYYKPDRVNAFDEVLEFPSYVIVLKDGREIDLYEHGEISDYEDALLEHLRNKGVPIKGAESKA